MIVEVPFGYWAGVVGKGQRKPRDRILKSSVLVDIQAFASSDAPLVFRWQKGLGVPAIDYRQAKEGALLTPVFAESGGAPSGTMSLEDAVKTASRGRRMTPQSNPLFAGEEFGMLMRGHFVSAENLEPGSRVVTSKESEIAARISSLAAELVVVDGQLFRKDPGSEPVYRVDGGEIATCRYDAVSLHMRDARRYFRIDQAPEALSAAGIAHPAGQPDADFDFENPETYRASFRQYVEVMDPTVITYRPNQDAVLRSGAAGFVFAFRESIADAAIDQMVAYGHLRDAVMRKDGAPVLCDLLERLAETTHDSWRQQILDVTEGYRLAPVAENPPSIGGPRP